MTVKKMNKEEVKEQMKQDALKKSEQIKTSKPKAVAPKQETLNVPMLTPAQIKARDTKIYEESVTTIVNEVKSLETSYVKIGYALYTIKENKLYKVNNKYKNVYELARSEFGISRGTCSDYISIIERFAKRQEGKLIPELNDKYSSYKISSLMVMSSIKDDKTVDSITPDMTVKEIKNAKKKSEGKDVKEPKQTIIDTDWKELRTTLICEIKSYEEISDSEAIIRKLLETGKRVQIVEAWEEYHETKGGV